MSMTETEFRKDVMAFAKEHGWHVYYVRDSRRVTSKGFPDLTMRRGHDVLFAELKTNAGRLTQDQQDWLLALGGVVWRPRDWPIITKRLQSLINTSELEHVYQ